MTLGLKTEGDEIMVNQLAKELIEIRVFACVNLMPVQFYFGLEGELVEAKELTTAAQNNN